LADRLAPFVEKVYHNPANYDGVSLAAATFYFSLQVYCDFSGYTDIALGIGKVLGYDFMENFDRPYFSRSIGEFWKRWHISLSSWLMDYLFLPIAYAVSRRIKPAEVLKVKAETWAYMTGIISTMALCGIWHGAQWTFLVWGAFHGLLLAFSFASKKLRRRIKRKLKIKKNALWFNLLRSLFTFLLVTFGWIFFRAGSLSDAYYIITHLFTGWGELLNPRMFKQALCFGLLLKELAVAGCATLAMLLLQILRKDVPMEVFFSKQKPVVRWSIYLLLLASIIVFAESQAGEFIYFRF
ncbi:MAG: hypothetical protein GY765_03210, partial [bacterium]|nr:hypothetical protein [bacterium]